MSDVDKKSISVCQTIDISTLCRLCLAKNSVEIDIFDDNQNISLPLRIMACASLEVNVGDVLPKKICTECRYQLEKSYVFRKRCKNSDTKLRRHLRQINSGKISKIFEMSDDEDEYSDSMEFFASYEEEQNAKLQQESDERERQFEERIKQFMDKERKKFREETEKSLSKNLKVFKRKKLKPKPSRIEIIPKEEPKILNKLINNDDDDEILEIENDIDYKLTNENTNNSEEIQEVNLNEEDTNEVMETSIIETSHDRINDHVQDIIDIGEIEQLDDDNDDEEEAQHEAMEQTEDETKDDSHFIINHTQGDLSDDDHISFSFQDDSEGFVINTKKPQKQDNVACYSLSKEQSLSVIKEEPKENNSLKSHTDNLISDEHFDIITKAIRSTLINETIINDDIEINYKLLKYENNKAQVLVELTDGTNYVMEVELPEKLENESYSCTECSKTFSKYANLKRHETSHTKDKGETCEECSKWFPSRSALQRHVRIHTGEKPFKCDVCERCFIQKEILKRHMITHTGIKPYPCPKCDMQFAQSDVLRQHLNRKHTENPVIEQYKCKLCSKKFSYPSGLSRHQLIHAGIRFPCSFCTRIFNDSSALKRHVATLHPNAK